MRSTNTRPARAAERVCLAFLAAGVTTYAFALAGMNRLEHETVAFDPARQVLFEGIAQYYRYEWCAKLGLSLVIAGLIGAVGASARTAWQRRAERQAAHRLLTIPSARAGG